MDLQALETLEQRVNKAVAVIAVLKNDKKKLEADNAALHDQLAKLTAKLQSVESAEPELEGLRAENQRLTKAQDEIRRRLEEIIAKLEKFRD